MAKAVAEVKMTRSETGRGLLITGVGLSLPEHHHNRGYPALVLAEKPLGEGGVVAS